MAGAHPSAGWSAGAGLAADVVVPASHVEPLDGVDYAGVPVARSLVEPEAQQAWREWQGDGPPPTGRGPAHD